MFLATPCAILWNTPTIVSFQDAVNNWPGDFVVHVNLFTLWSKNCVKRERLWRFGLVTTWRRVDRDCTTHFINLMTRNPTPTAVKFISNWFCLKQWQLGLWWYSCHTFEIHPDFFTPLLCYSFLILYSKQHGLHIHSMLPDGSVIIIILGQGVITLC